jgi:hypothetical protein
MIRVTGIHALPDYYRIQPREYRVSLGKREPEQVSLQVSPIVLRS